MIRKTTKKTTKKITSTKHDTHRLHITLSDEEFHALRRYAFEKELFSLQKAIKHAVQEFLF